ncbi:MAG: response regulator [Gemmatimonadota bacterium]
MTLGGTVLIVDDDHATLNGYAELLRSHPELRVFTARSGQEGLTIARVQHPDIILSDLRMEGMDGIALCSAVKKDPSIEGTMFVIVTGMQDAHVVIADSGEGIDDTLLKPVTAGELFAKVRAMLRLKRVTDQLRADNAEVERLHHALETRFDQILELLVHLIDLRVPGAALRGQAAAELSAQLAERFEIPTALRRDLDVAARVHELGKVALCPDQERPSDDASAGDDWRYVIATEELLRRTEGLHEASEIVAQIYENWDGTGHPEHHRQGQIALRSRILRIVIDFLELQAVEPNPIAAVEQLALYGGTRYDPLTVAYLDAIVRASQSTSWRDERSRVPVSNLEEGMVLADDLTTSSGVKLLAKGAVITANSLETILRRHGSDPILHGAWIERSAHHDHP